MLGKLKRYDVNAKVQNKTYRNAVHKIYKSYYSKDPKVCFEQMQGVIRVAVEDNAISGKTFKGLLNLRSRAFYKANNI